jgi:hypothetical protein
MLLLNYFFPEEIEEYIVTNTREPHVIVFDFEVAGTFNHIKPVT